MDYENVLYEQGDAPEFDRSSWLTVKPSLGLDFPNLPYYIDGDLKITESNAIIKYIAAKYDDKLLGRTIEEVAKVEMIMSVVMDMKNAVTSPCYATGDRAQISTIISEKLPPIVAFLGANDFLVGDQVVFVDFVFFELLNLCDFVTEGKTISENSSLKAYVERVKDLKNIRAYFEGEHT